MIRCRRILQKPRQNVKYIRSPPFADVKHIRSPPFADVKYIRSPPFADVKQKNVDFWIMMNIFPLPLAMNTNYSLPVPQVVKME